VSKSKKKIIKKLAKKKADSFAVGRRQKGCQCHLNHCIMRYHLHTKVIAIGLQVADRIGRSNAVVILSFISLHIIAALGTVIE
jgi:hypothetical protein